MKTAKAGLRILITDGWIIYEVNKIKILKEIINSRYLFFFKSQ